MNCVKSYLAPHIKKVREYASNAKGRKKKLMQTEQRTAHQRNAPVCLCVWPGDTPHLNELSEVKQEKYQHNTLPGSSLPVCLHSDTAE